MCTKNLVEAKDNLVGWKVVKIEKNGEVCSFYQYNFKWQKGANIAIKKFKNVDEMFHCFARRSDARRFYKAYKPCVNEYMWQDVKDMKIIKVILKGDTWKGMTNGMRSEDHGDFNNIPATCGTIAEWDGKLI